MNTIDHQDNTYQTTEKIYESDNSLVYRGVLKKNNKPIILKILKENYPTSSELIRYKQEYEIIRDFKADNIIKGYDLQRYENSLVLLLEDFGGKSLKSFIFQRQFSFEKCLNIAIKITESLAIIHQAGIIHKDINPSNIVYNPSTEQLKIIDFGISTRLTEEFITDLIPNQLEGTLAYIAPEQTGRMNRGIDYRSDFYSLGVTFYELFSNRLPYDTTDPIELIHFHIAQNPTPIHQLIPEFPIAISNIITKLLAKIPEERYQSALGIKADFKTCLNYFKSTGKISRFTLGKQDISGKFHIPKKLYGREQEVKQLLSAFEVVNQGTCGIVLIPGYSGIGKSALVDEIHKPITCQRGNFITGKFDQLQRDIPYFAVAQAFRDLINRLLCESESILLTWKKRILQALGTNGQIIIDVIPELEKIIGSQPSVTPLSGARNQNRFNLFFKRFVSVFCDEKHPLAIFLDDLQWADLPSLNLIEQLVLDPEQRYFLMIAAYRDNEISQTHPFNQTLEKINQSNITVSRITLSPLKLNHINQLIAETLNCSTQYSKPLAKLVSQKTEGNPFFLTQLLSSLYQENLLVFHFGQNPAEKKCKQNGYWTWDLKKIQSVSITDNVIDLMVKKIEKLNHSSQKILKLAACIGNQFNLQDLSIVNKQSQLVTARELQLILQKGLIIPLDNKYKITLLWDPQELSDKLSKDFLEHSEYIPFKFLHDRVQQAAYSLIEEEEKQHLHLEIGRLLLKNIDEAQLTKNIFDIVNQLNQGYRLITDPLEKNNLARLNLTAIRKAKDSSAYETALIYVEVALKLLSSDSWINQYDLTLEIYKEAIQVQYINYQFSQAETLSAIVLENVKEVLDTVDIYESKINYLHAQLKLDELVATTFEILEKLGISLPSEVGEQKRKIHELEKAIANVLRDKSISELANLPSMSEPYKLAAVRLLVFIIPSSLIYNAEVAALVTLTALNLSLKFGNSPLATSVYCCYGIVISSLILTQDVQSGYQFGQLSYKLLNQQTNDEAKPFVIIHYYGFIRHWKEPFRQIQLNHFEDAIQLALERGDFQISGYNLISYCLFSIFRGFNLEEFSPKYIAYGESIKPEQAYAYHYYRASQKMALNLLNEDREKYYLLFKNTEEEEEALLQSWIESKTDWLLFITCLSKTFAAYFFKDYEKALEFVYLSEKHSLLCSAYLIYPQNLFYSTLTLLAVYPSQDKAQQSIIIEKVSAYQRQMLYYRDNCPENYENKYFLIEAEKASVLGEYLQAEEFYEKAIQGAKNYQYIHEEALAYERAAEFYLALEREEIGQFYLRNSHHCYIRWGAKAKIKQLEEKYPQYFVGIVNTRITNHFSPTTSTTGKYGRVLDLRSIFKASQVISGEIKLEKLLQQLMKFIVENAGAQKGSLILKKHDHWAIEAQGSVDDDIFNVLQSIPIKRVDSDSSEPILPTSVINYVFHKQEYLVLNNAVEEVEFYYDPYIFSQQTKSILCTPLLNQGKLRGIVYLENNLTTGAFTAERVEIVNILSTQAAISIDNSRLYQTLEQRVKERTQELSQTLDVLKATQAQLVFENELLKSDQQSTEYDYQVGGSLAMDAPTYVVRSADRYLYKVLKQGEFCYILNPRQMGKSSLMVPHD